MNDLQKQTCLAIVNVFETGSPNGNYGSVTVVKGDAGHLTYGRSQTTLASGNLYLLIKAYVENPAAQFSTELKPYLDRLAAKDLTLDGDLALRSILREAGADPVMRIEQDGFFDRAYFDPAMRSAQNVGLTLPLSQTVVYDSKVHGNWAKLAGQILASAGKVSAACPEQEWVSKYVAARRNYLLSSQAPLPSAVYRMDAFDALMKDDRWDLALPITVHKVQIADATFNIPIPVAPPPRVSALDAGGEDFPLLRPVKPYTKGPDVLRLQTALDAAGFKNSKDQIYGPFTQALVMQFQRHAGMKADAVVGPQTWSLLLKSDPA